MIKYVLLEGHREYSLKEDGGNHWIDEDSNCDDKTPKDVIIEEFMAENRRQLFENKAARAVMLGLFNRSRLGVPRGDKTNCWVNRRGEIFHVPFSLHLAFAHEVVGVTESDLEKEGWVKVTDGFMLFIGSRLTKQQLRALETLPINIPEEWYD